MYQNLRPFISLSPCKHCKQESAWLGNYGGWRWGRLEDFPHTDGVDKEERFQVRDYAAPGRPSVTEGTSCGISVGAEVGAAAGAGLSQRAAVGAVVGAGLSPRAVVGAALGAGLSPGMRAGPREARGVLSGRGDRVSEAGARREPTSPKINAELSAPVSEALNPGAPALLLQVPRPAAGGATVPVPGSQ